MSKSIKIGYFHWHICIGKILTTNEGGRGPTCCGDSLGELMDRARVWRGGLREMSLWTSSLHLEVTIWNHRPRHLVVGGAGGAALARGARGSWALSGAGAGDIAGAGAGAGASAGDIAIAKRKEKKINNLSSKEKGG